MKITSLGIFGIMLLAGAGCINLELNKVHNQGESVCYYKNHTISVGQSYDDGCNTHTCQLDGTLLSTERACEIEALSYADSTFGVSFQYPKGFDVTKREPVWTSKETYLAWLNSPASNTGGIGVNNIASFNDEDYSRDLIVTLSVAPLDRYNAYETMYKPETDQSFVVNGVKVYKTVIGNTTSLYWQNTHKPSLETLWNSLTISGESASDASSVTALIQSTLSIE